ncbi:hypothetical protein CEK27_010624 [Fusarium fujikuroi]|nr:hypothetical protein CEK27_010624 [Fusarium fujikuroi]
MSVDTWRLPYLTTGADDMHIRPAFSKQQFKPGIVPISLRGTILPETATTYQNTPSLDRSHVPGNPSVQYYRTWEQALGSRLAHATAAVRPFLPCTEQPRRHIPDLAIVSSAIGAERSIPLTSRTRVSRTPITIREDAIPSISSQFGLSRDFTSNPTVQGFDSHLFSGQGPTAVDIKTTKKLAEPMLEPSPLPTHPLQPTTVPDRKTDLARADRGMSPAGSMITSWPNPFHRWHVSTAETSCYLPPNARQDHTSVATNTSDFLLNYRHALPLHRNECRTQGFVGSKPGHPASFVPDSVSDLLSLLLQTLAVDPPCRHLFRGFKPAIPSASQ